MTNVDTTIRIGSATLKNPVIAASGCYNRGAEYARVTDVGAFGAITIKSITSKPRLGNAMPRVIPVPGGLLNAIVGSRLLGPDKTPLRVGR